MFESILEPCWNPGEENLGTLSEDQEINQGKNIVKLTAVAVKDIAQLAAMMLPHKLQRG
jgi:hypothetical protein